MGAYMLRCGVGLLLLASSVDGRGGIQIPFAVNDSVGKWVVSVRDVLTGKTERRPIEVQNAKSHF